MNRSLLIVAAAVLAAAGVAAYVLLRPPVAPPPAGDPVAAAHANARGVGHIERFRYGEAAKEFEEAVRLAPGWRPAKINLGIALFNDVTSRDDPKLDRSLAVFADVLKDDPDDKYALFCTAIIHRYRGDYDAAFPLFDKVSRLDPADAHARYFRGATRPDANSDPASKADYEAALAIDPNLNAARYGVAQHAHERDDAKSAALLAEHGQLAASLWEKPIDDKYTAFGKYAEVIGSSPAPPPGVGPLPLFRESKPALAGTRVGGEADELTKAVRGRFGWAVSLLDFNGDGRPDVLLPGPGGYDLLRNDGANFTVVTAAAGLADAGTAFGVAVADFDNDGRPDLLFTGPNGVKLYRNLDGAKFADVTAAAGLAALKGVCLAACWLDLDQDGDLDLVVGKYADTPADAVRLLKGEAAAGGKLVGFANVGEAPPNDAGGPPLPLAAKFQTLAAPDALLPNGPVAGIVATDLDGDRDVDLVVLIDNQAPVTILNDRLMRFRRGDPLPVPAAKWVGGLALDANADEQSDLLLLPAGGRPVLLVSATDSPGAKFADRFKPGATDAPPLRQAVRCDVDLDGRSDVVGLDADGKPVLLHGDGAGKLGVAPEALGSVATAAGLAVADVDGDGNPDVLLGGDGVRLLRGAGNGNRGLKLRLTGRREKKDDLRTNADAVGSRVLAHAGPLRTGAELVTAAAGLGQGSLPLHLGLGREETADAVRIRWPDLVTQAELNKAAGEIHTIREENRKPTSCPVLFTWDGSRFVYVTDFLGAGSVGETGADGGVRPPRPAEAVKIEPHQLAAKNGKFAMKIGEPMDEVCYLDHLKLVVIDHPAGVAVHPDERFATADPQPTGDLLAFADRRHPVKATDHRGRDVTAKLKARDRNAVDAFAVRSWLGYAEDHWVELDFGGKPPTGRVFLVLAGWTEYPFPEAIYAATQAGVAMVPPVLEQKQPNGSWKSLGEIGFPAGLTRVMTADVTGKLDPAAGPVRVRSNLQIYWDEIYLSAAAPAPAARELPVSRAALEHRGFVQEVSPGGRPPIEYDYDRLEPVSVTKWKGRLTRLGDVTELLAAEDDRHALVGPGDELTVEFDAAGLPPVKEGWARSFVLRTAGYCKDTAPTTAGGGVVGPLPYRGMPAYPYDPAKVPPHVAAYDRKWNTRPANGGR